MGLPKELKTDLKSISSFTRKNAIKRLGELSSPEAVGYLLHVANGKARTWFGNICGAYSSHRYGLDDQLVAIEELGKIDHPRANAYVKGLVRCNLAEREAGAQWWDDSDGSGPPDPVPDGTDVYFPGGSELLRYTLSYKTIWSIGNGYREDGSAHLPDNPVGHVIKNAFERVIEQEKVKEVA